MQIKSTSFNDNRPIPTVHTCVGGGSCPLLIFSDVPTDAQSLVLWVHDPDAPTGDFTHWVVWNIPPSSNELVADTLPPGAVQGMNDFGKQTFGAPCPPNGTGAHHYIFELFALNDVLTLPPTASAQDCTRALQAHVLDHATLTGTVTAA